MNSRPHNYDTGLRKDCLNALCLSLYFQGLDTAHVADHDIDAAEAWFLVNSVMLAIGRGRPNICELVSPKVSDV